MTDTDAAEEKLRALMLDALTGSKPAYRLLLIELGDRLRAYYRRRLTPEHAAVEDLVQETLIAIHMRRFTYDRTRRFTPWLHAIARYKLVDFLRDRRNARSISLDEAEDLFAPDDAQAGLDRMDVDRLLATIPPKTGELIRAVKIEGRSVAEASADAGMSESATKVAIHRGLKLLSKRLNKGKALGDNHG